MRNLKKLLAVIVAICVIATFTVPAFAASTISEDAQICADIGLLEGDAGAVDATYLAKETQRYQAAIIYLRLFGKEDEALAYEGTDNFDDAGLFKWAEGKNILAYLYDNPELGWVGDAGKFDPFRTTTAQEIYKVLLTALGYEEDVDFTWDETIDFAAEKGLTKIADLDKLTNDDLAAAIVEALKINIKDENKTLVEKLVEDGIVDKDAAIDAGLIADELEVKSVEADNLKQVKVIYNKDITDEAAAGDADNYSFKDAEIADVDVDGSTAVLTLKADQAQQSEETLKVSNKILKEAKEFVVEFVDTDFPEVVSADVIGSNTIKVVFTEPIDGDDLTRSQKRDGFTLTDADGKKIYVDDVDFESNNTVAKVSFYTTFKEATYDFTVNAKYKDYAGFTVLKKEVSFDIVPDTEAPELVDFKDAKPYSVTLIFNEDIEFTGKVKDIYHTNSKNPASKVTVEGKEIKVEFASDSKMPAGTVYVYVAGETVKDLWNNKQTQQQRIAITVTGDDAAPEIEKVEATAQDALKVTYNEDVDEKTAEERDNYTILDKDGKEIKNLVRTATRDEDNHKVVVLALRENISGDNTLVIENVEDLYGNDIDKLSFDFFAEDKTAPDPDDFKAYKYLDKDEDGVDRIVVDYGEEMSIDGTYSVLDIDKYKISSSATGNEWVSLSKYKDDISISSVGADKKVEISLEKDKDNKNFFKSGMRLQIGRVADAAGNKTDAFSFVVDLGDQPKIGAKEAKAVSKTEIKLTLEDALADFDENDFVLYTATTTIGSEKYEVDEELSSGKSVITFTLLDVSLDTTAKYNGNPVSIKTVAEGDVDSENEYGSKVEISGKAVDDAIAPELKVTNDKPEITRINGTSGQVIEIIFTENVALKSADLAATDFVIIDEDGDQLKALDHYTISASADKITIDLKGKYEYYLDELTVETIDPVKYIFDNVSNDNILKAFGEKDVVWTTVFDKYETIVAHSNAVVAADYTADSWDKYQTEITNCDRSLTDAAAVATLNAEIADIQDALDLLVEK